MQVDEISEGVMTEHFGRDVAPAHEVRPRKLPLMTDICHKDNRVYAP